MNEASQRQIAAAHPQSSTWLSANAGSGKTRVLTDRVARLLLAGAPPQNILCLTYTKAAASEMQNRLFKRLGAWAMLDDADLHAELAQLGVDTKADSDTLTQARRLFARAIETPGGLRIQTIHSFCAVILRRFPLEAGVSPQFAEMDERTARLLRAEIVDVLAEAEIDIMDGLARYHTSDDLEQITQEIASKRAAFLPRVPDVALRQLHGIAPGLTEKDILDRAFLGGEADLLEQVVEAMRLGSPQDQKDAAKLSAISTPFTLKGLAILEGVFLTGAKAKQPFSAKVGKIPTKATRARLGHIADDVDDLMLRIEAARRDRINYEAAQRTVALHHFAQAFLPLYEAQKSARGLLDFDDLILKARDLLTDAPMAAWILFRLDGGIDHILVDEAQDTSPVQWQVIEALTQEFTAGDGRRSATERTLFVVGDKKQSIYSFQGADPTAFDQMSAQFAQQLENAAPLQRLQLHHSFRSSDAILRAVDATFDGDIAQGLGPDVKHLAFNADTAGRVDLWPLVPVDPAPEKPAWYDPVDTVSPRDGDVRLAEGLAKTLRDMIDRGETVPNGTGGRRPVTEGDVLILLRRRGALFHNIIRACKAQGLEIAGADRLNLASELAVQDLRALLAFLLTPEDDLSLATLLKSPLFGWSEGMLYDLAAPRGDSYLWQALRGQDQHAATREVLQDLLNDADYLRPYDLLDRILLRHKGRQNLIARLGPEAEDGIDELLVQALAYERLNIPSLTGFLTWLEADDIEVKREAEAAGRKLRVMTVHGAKGLEAPIVILPDTISSTRDVRDQIIKAPDGTALWKTAQDDRPNIQEDALTGIIEKDAAEAARLLYVAMTRAERWLIVCGRDRDRKAKQTWYDDVATGIDRCNAPLDPIETPFGTGKRMALGLWEAGAVSQRSAQPDERTLLPDWFANLPPDPVDQPRVLSPSDLGGAKVILGDPNEYDEVSGKARGNLIHLLLEHLDAAPPDEWETIAERILHGVPPEILAGLFDEASAVLTDAALAPILVLPAFVEVPITAHVEGQPILGVIDRLIVQPDRVLIIDYKSNAVVPADPAQVPNGLLRQMAVYRDAIGQIYPDKRVETALLWTRTPLLMHLPDTVLDNARAILT